MDTMYYPQVNGITVTVISTDNSERDWICSKCGKKVKVSDYTEFCTECGHRLKLCYDTSEHLTEGK